MRRYWIAAASVLVGLGPGRGRDSVDCGRGLETVFRDAFDALRRNCERRR